MSTTYDPEAGDTTSNQLTVTPQWNPLDEPRDKAVIEGVPTPGYCEVMGATTPRKWDEVDGYGWSGGLLIYHGLPVCRFGLVLTLYDAADWNDWHAFKPLVQRPPRFKRPRALAIEHPQLAELGIAAMVVADCTQASQSDDGVWQITVSCIEWRQLTASGVAKPDGTEPAEPSETQKAIADITAQNKELRDQLAKIGNVFGGGGTGLLGGLFQGSGANSESSSSGKRGL